MEHTIPSSSEVSSIQAQIPTVHSIAERGIDQSSILECLHGKVSELLKYKEKSITLEKQVKIAEEMLELQKAETAFMQEEYEKEIESLKQREQIHVSAQQHEVDVRLQQAESNSSELKSKYEKWKGKAKNSVQQAKQLESQVRKLQKENENAKEEVDELKSTVKSCESEISSSREASMRLTEEAENLTQKLAKANKRVSEVEQENVALKNQLHDAEAKIRDLEQKMQGLKGEMKQTKNDQKGEVERLQARTKDLASEKNELEGQVRKMKAQLKGQKMEIESLSAEQSGAADSAALARDQMTALEEENQRLRLQVKSLTLATRKMSDIEEAAKKEHQMVLHCEEEMTNICDTLGINPCQIDGEWTSICETCRELLAVKGTVDQVRSQNAKLQKRLMAIVSDKSRSERQPVICDDDDCLAGVLESVRDLRDKIDQRDKVIKGLRYRALFSAHLVEQYLDTCSRIEALHSSIFDEPRHSARPLFLAILFTRRMDRYRRASTTNDPKALKVFEGRLEYAPDRQLMQIQQKITGLTNDLVAAKQTLAQLADDVKLSAGEKDTMTLQIRTNKDKAELATEKVKCMKQRITELQEELATLVSTEMHDEVCEQLEATQDKVRHLKKVVLKYAKEIEARDNIERELRDRIEEVQLEAEQEAARSKEIKNQMLIREKQVEALELVIKEKTKEILALERLVTRQKEKAAVASTSMNIMAVENRTLFQNIAKDGPETPVMLKPELHAPLSDTPQSFKFRSNIY